MTKRLLSLLLALMTVFSLSIPAYAADGENALADDLELDAPIAPAVFAGGAFETENPETPAEPSVTVEPDDAEDIEEIPIPEDEAIPLSADEPMATADDVLASGTDGNITWQIIRDPEWDGILRISGNGPMKDYQYDCNESPWMTNEWYSLIKRVEIENGVTRVGNYAFRAAKRPSFLPVSISISNTVTSIGAYAFCDNIVLTSLSIPSSVTSIEEGAFSGNTKLSSLTLGSGLKTVGKQAFYNCALSSVSIPAGVTSIGAQAFGYSGSSPKANFTIQGTAGTQAEVYAKNNGFTFTASSGTTTLATPKISSVTNTTNGVTVKWSAVTGAAKYRIYYKTGSGSWVKLTDTASTSYTWTGAKSSTKYSFTVSCLDNSGKEVSDYDATGKSITTPAAKNGLVKDSDGVMR